MTAKYNGPNDRIKKSEDRQSKVAKAEGLTSEGNFEQRRSGWDREENKAACFERGAYWTLWLQVSRFPQIQNGNGNGRSEGGKVDPKLLISIPRDANNRWNNEEQEVNIATRQVNLSGVPGSGQRGEKDWSKECSEIADAGFSGGGLRSHAWVQRYVMYLRSFYPETNLVKYKENVLRFVFWESPGAWFRW